MSNFTASQAYMWKCLASWEGAPCRLLTGSRQIGPSTNRKTWCGYFLQLPNGEVWRDPSNVSPFHLRRDLKSKRPPARKKIEAAILRLHFTEKTQRSIRASTTHKKSLMFELQGLSKIFPHLSNDSMYYDTNDARSPLANFLFTDEQAMEYHRLWSIERDQKIVAVSQRAAARLELRV